MKPNPPSGRPRAPTITIDTSPLADGDQTPAQQQPTSAAPAPSHTDPPAQPTPLATPPTSSSNNGGNLMASPTTIFSASPNNFLAVPHAERRPREGSMDSSTYVASDDPRTSVGGDSTADDTDPLQPDPGREADFVVENNKFAFAPGQLLKMVERKSMPALQVLGGPDGLAKGLRTDLSSGLDVEERALDGQVTFRDATGREAPEIHIARPSSHQEESEPSKGGKFSKRFKKKPKADQDALPVYNPNPGPEDPFTSRIQVFKDNRLPEKKAKGFLTLLWMTYNDKVLIMLTIAAVISLAIGIPQSLRHGDPEWVEGVAIFVAVFVVSMVGALNDWQKEKQFVKLNRKKDERTVKVIRSGKTLQISVFEILTGDLAMLETGDLVPVDGIFIEGHNVKCDESSATGESDLLKKTPAADVFRALERGENTRKMDPFILSGSKVNEGWGRFLVTGTGVNSTYGRIMMSLRHENEATPLQSKLNVLAEYIAKIGGAAALLYFVVAFIEFLVRITRGAERDLAPDDKGQEFLQIFILAVSIIVVAVPEGLPLAVTLALAFATIRMLKDNNLVRVLRSCETMGNATTVCSDKTGTLTQNKMTVVAGTIGKTFRFGDREEPPKKKKDSTGKMQDAEVSHSGEDVTPQEFVKGLAGEVKKAFVDAVALNSTAFETETNGKTEFVGSKTETALLSFASEYLAMQAVNVERSNSQIVQMVPFDSARKCMAVVVRLPNNRYRMYVKGASEILLSKCAKIIAAPNEGLADREMSTEDREMIAHVISVYASRSLRTIGLVHRDFEQWPPAGVRKLEDEPDAANFDDVFAQMTFFSLVGIQDPLRPGVTEAIADCRRAGVFVRMVTGDNVQTAKAIATACGIYTDGGAIIEGPEFRKLSSSELDNIVPRLQVLARSSPEDKQKLVKKLKELGHTVAATGDGTNDAPALKVADIGFAMGIAGTEVAKEASDIILMDDNFLSIVKALLWGRAVNDAVKKFLQFQVTVNITAVITTFFTGIISQNGEAVLSAVQLLWVNLIMDTMAALALATDPPSRSLLDRPPEPKSASLITVTMWKMIIGQSIYQLVVVFVLYYQGVNILVYWDSQWETDSLDTLIFNAFVWMQIFNSLNNRRLDNHFNIFEGITRNWFFLGIFAIMVGAQILIIFVGGKPFNVIQNPTLRADQWGISLVLGFMTIPIGMAIRLIPDGLCRALVPSFLKRRAAPKLKLTDAEGGRYEWNTAINEVRDELLWLKRIKGGRLTQLKFAVRHPLESGLFSRPSSAFNRSRSSTNTSAVVASHGTDAQAGHESTRPVTPLNPSPEPSRSPTPDPKARRGRRQRSRSNSAFGPAVAAAGIVAGSIAGWSPIERPSGSELPPPSYRSRASSNVAPATEEESGGQQAQDQPAKP